jgi:hypothetical protein
VHGDPENPVRAANDEAQEPLVEAFGTWGQRWVSSELSLQHLDVSLLMWDMRRNLDPTPMLKRRSVIQFLYPELSAAQRSWWLIVDPRTGADLCSVDPGFDVDLRLDRFANDDGHLDGPGQRPPSAERTATEPDR